MITETNKDGLSPSANSQTLQKKIQLDSRISENYHIVFKYAVPSAHQIHWLDEFRRRSAESHNIQDYRNFSTFTTAKTWDRLRGKVSWQKQVRW